MLFQGRVLVNSYESYESYNWINCISLSRSSGEIACHYSYSQSSRAVRRGVVSTRTTPSSRSSGEIAYHSSYLQSGRAVRKGSFQLVRLFQVVQVVKLHINRLTGR